MYIRMAGQELAWLIEQHVIDWVKVFNEFSQAYGELKKEGGDLESLIPKLQPYAPFFNSLRPVLGLIKDQYPTLASFIDDIMNLCASIPVESVN